jgi:hypothetical protein
MRNVLIILTLVHVLVGVVLAFTTDSPAVRNTFMLPTAILGMCWYSFLMRQWTKRMMKRHRWDERH